jgi:signal transduction histidine kinase
VLAIAASAFTVHLTRPAQAEGHLTRPEQAEGPVRVVSRSISGHLSRQWDDPGACEAYVDHLRESMGLDLRLRRDPNALPPQVRRMAGRGAPFAFTRDGRAYIPVSRAGEVVGAVEFDSGAPVGPHVAQLVAALGVALLVLGLMAVRVSRQLAHPLEQVAVAAERFGDGDLSARTHMGERPRRWVALEVAEVADAFDRMAGRIEGVVRDQRELLAAISHELRSPLGRARVALEIARERSLGGAASAPLDDVEKPLGEIDAILGDLLAAARAGLSDLRKEPTALLPWLRAKIAAEPARPVVELVAPDDAEGLSLSVDPALLGRAVHNLLANARNHGHPDGEALEVRVETDDPSCVRIVVKDHGPGFSEDLLPRVFEPFVRGDAARSPGGGTGLGLALVRRIAEAHGGRAFARNLPAEQTRGAEVGIDLPR